MVDVVVPLRNPGIGVVELAPTAQQLSASAAIDASIDAYLGAGDGMAMIMGLTLKVCAALIVLIAVAWALGVLPGAVRLF
jgi:hypothetical protein